MLIAAFTAVLLMVCGYGIAWLWLAAGEVTVTHRALLSVPLIALLLAAFSGRNPS